MSAAGKIAKVGSPDETELSVAQALYDLETSVPDLKKELRPLQFNSAREVPPNSKNHELIYRSTFQVERKLL